jgi:hypothetical protein
MTMSLFVSRAPVVCDAGSVREASLPALSWIDTSLPSTSPAIQVGRGLARGHRVVEGERAGTIAARIGRRASGVEGKSWRAGHMQRLVEGEGDVDAISWVVMLIGGRRIDDGRGGGPR